MDWGVAGVAVGIIGVMVGALGLWYAWRQRPLRELSYREVLNVPLFRVAAPLSARDRLQVLFDGQPVKDARIVVIKLANTGNEPIRPDDQLSPITFPFVGAEILWADITSTTPDHLKPGFGWGQGPDRAELTLSPLLFNAGYGVELTVVLQGFRGDVAAPQAQIVGVNEIVRYHDPRDRAPYKHLRIIGPLVAAVISVAASVLILADHGQPVTPLLIALLALAVTGLVPATVIVVGAAFRYDAVFFRRRPQLALHARRRRRV